MSCGRNSLSSIKGTSVIPDTTRVLEREEMKAEQRIRLEADLVKMDSDDLQNSSSNSLTAFSQINSRH